MKKALIIIFTIIFCLPIKINAQTKALDLEATLKDEGIVAAFDNYSETENQIVIYLFRGAGCIHCHDFLEFLNDFAKDNGELFKLRSFEVYNNADNSKLKSKVAEHFKDRSGGVPYIIIGERTFYGFSIEDGEEIANAIKEEYNNSEHYDVFDDLERTTTKITTVKKKTTERPKSSAATIILLIFVIIFGIPVIFSGLIFKKKDTKKKSK